MSKSFQWPECVAAMASQIERSCGIDRDQALRISEIAAIAIRREFGGKRIYIPAKNGEFRARVIAEFNGRNIAELSRRYGLSCTTVRRYVGKK